MSNIFKEVLIFVAGSTPQIITETLYALSQKNPPIHVQEIFIITTAVGKRRIKETLLDQGIFQRLCKEYNIPPLNLSDDSFFVIRDKNGRELDDIRDVEANEAAGDQIAEFLRIKSAEPNCRLHCSLAGGRKSMSYYMGTAFQLFARQWDKLYHVLVSPDFEQLQCFYYKPKSNQRIEVRLRNGTIKHLYTDEAIISLVELPLILLRNKFSFGNGSIREIVAQGQKNMDAAVIQQPIRVVLEQRKILIGDNVIKMRPTPLMVYVAFLRRKINQLCEKNRNRCYECYQCFMHINDLVGREPLERMALDYEKIYDGNQHKSKDLLQRWSGGLFPEQIRQNICKINKSLDTNILDPRLLSIYRITSKRKYGETRYGVRIEKENISII